MEHFSHDLDEGFTTSRALRAFMFTRDSRTRTKRSNGWKGHIRNAWIRWRGFAKIRHRKVFKPIRASPR
jgi:hypothetical protein